MPRRTNGVVVTVTAVSALAACGPPRAGEQAPVAQPDTVVVTVPQVPQARCDSVPDRIAEVRGVLALRGSPRRAGATVTVFNGFELRTGVSADDGSYCVPLRRSTRGTFVSVFATMDGYTPDVRNVQVVVDSLQPAGAVAQIAVAPTILAPLTRPNVGVVIGVAYIRTTSGRPRPQEGIIEYVNGLDVTIEGGGGRTALRTSATGSISSELPPGTYRNTTSKNVVVDAVQVGNGRTTIVPLFSGERINF
jgi:hypothetical protein